MDTHSSSQDQFIDEKFHEWRLPYQSLLGELHTLMVNHEASFLPGTGKECTFRLTSRMRRHISTLEQELRFQQMVFIFLKNFIFSNQRVVSEALIFMQAKAEELNSEIISDLKYLRAFEWLLFFFKAQDFGVSKFLENTDQKIKPHLKEICLGILDQLLKGVGSSSNYDISEFLDIILLKLKDLEISKPNMILPVKKQMETLEGMLRFFPIIVRRQASLDESVHKFLAYFGPWVNIAAGVVMLYWVDERDEELLFVITSSLQKFNLSSVELVEAYIIVIKALKPSNVSEILIMREAVGCFTNILLDNLSVSIDDRFAMIKEGLALWIALLMDPPKADAEDEKLICAQINFLVDQAESIIRLLFCQDKLGDDINTERRIVLLNDFIEKISRAKAKVRPLHVQIPGLLWNNVPHLNGEVFFDFLLENLQNKLESEADMFPFEKHLIEIFHDELLLIRPFLMDTFEVQDQHKELRDIWVLASKMAHLVDFVTDSCLSSDNVPIWSNLMYLSNAIEQLQFVKIEVSKIRENGQKYDNRVISGKLNSIVFLPRQEQAIATSKDEVMVGFKHEEQKIIDWLVGGVAWLDIVAIVGMPGQGKTNLAHRVCQDACIRTHFHKYAWCCITQAYDIKRILLDILENVGEIVSPEQFSYLAKEDLADRLRKCLKGQRYLVVLDDMWDANAWCELQLSFPNDNNGSRILLTSRIHNVALKVKADCCIVKLHPLSQEESWNLLQMKVFEKDFCPPNLFDIGKTIAKNCKGLPLSIVVVAGLLKKDKNVDSWKQISESLKPQIASEGCMSILDLSYNHLPDYLKPCFLYLGAFQEDQIIDAKVLIQFWIAEGFVKNDGIQTVEVVAKEYLIDLVGRSLVFVTQRSCNNGIKNCRIHDLLRHFCLMKAEEERFLLVPNVSDPYSSIRCTDYRLCVHDKRCLFLDSKPIIPSLRSLLVCLGTFHHSSYAPGFLKGFKLIKVLDLSSVVVTLDDFYEITQFIHLRLLAVACGFRIPSSIVNLLRLEVLRVRIVSAPLTIPSTVLKMTNLRHIFSRGCTIEYVQDIDKMAPGSPLPLTNLETFTSFNFRKESSFHRVAKKLPNVVKLGLRLSFCVLLSGYFKKLEKLNLHICCWRHKDFLAISRSKLDFPLTLKKLNLRALTLSGAVISSIGKLSNLEVLKLDAEFEDKRWDVEDDEFLQLKYLKLTYAGIGEWNVSDESFPCLEQLLVHNCFQLRELPGRFGVLTTLKRIEVVNCSESISDSFQQIVDEQIDSGNESLQSSCSKSEMYLRCKGLWPPN